MNGQKYTPQALFGLDYVTPDFELGAALLTGSAGGDRLLGQTLADTIVGDAGDDVLRGGEGNDTLTGGEGNDTYWFGAGEGDTTIYLDQGERASQDVIRFTSDITENDVSIVQSGLTQLQITVRQGDAIDQVITVEGYTGVELQDIQFGNGLAWDTPYRVKEATLGIVNNKPSIIYTDLPTETAVWNAAKIKLNAREGNEHANIVYGNSSDNRLFGHGGNDTLHGLSGRDQLFGGEGNDVLWGGAGNDLLTGGEGSDTYHYRRGDGDDIIYLSVVSSMNDTDVLQFDSNINASDVSLYRQGEALVLTLDDDSKVFLSGYFYAYQQTQVSSLDIHFSDGSRWDTEFVLAALLAGSPDDDVIVGYAGNDVIDGGAGNDIIDGREGNDLLLGGEGADTLIGGLGNDTYWFNEGDDYTVINNNTTYGALAGLDDVIRFGDGISVSDVALSSSLEYGFVSGYHYSTLYFTLTVKETEVIEVHVAVQPFLAESLIFPDAMINRIEFADGTVWNQSYLINQVNYGVRASLYDTHGPENEEYWDRAIDYYVSQGIDQNTLLDESYREHIQTGIGHDVVVGYTGSDILKGGSGNDTISGYYGHDVLSGEAGNDLLSGGYGHDTLNGGQGNDTYVATNGSDVINEAAVRNEIDTLVSYRTDLSAVTFAASGNDLLVSIASANYTARITNGLLADGSGVEAFVFYSAYRQSESIRFTLDQVKALIAGDVVASDDELIDTDIIGAQTFLVADLLKNDLNNAQNAGIANVFSAMHGSVILNAQEGTILFTPEADYSGPASFDYAVNSQNGSSDVATVSFVVTAAVSVIEEGTENDDTLLGNESNNEMHGLGGDDYIQGVAGDDLLVGGSGNDTLIGDEGSDTLIGDEGNDFLLGNADNDNLSGLAGDDVLNGGAGNDDLSGGAGNDTLIGGTGNDFLWGNTGDDTYVFSGDFGQDRINNHKGHFDNDTIRFDEIAKDDLWFSRSENGKDLLITVAGTDNEVILRSWYSETLPRTVSKIVVGDLHLYLADINALTDIMSATGLSAADVAENGISATILERLQTTINSRWQSEASYQYQGVDLINGTDGDDVINGFASNDKLYGLAGDDRLNGGSENDTLNGGEGNDTLIGGTGNDFLWGNTGDDTYVFSGDFGQDRINNHKGDFDNDTLRFDEIAKEDLWFSRSENGKDLLITVAGTDNEVILRSWYSETFPRTVSKIVVGDLHLYLPRY